MSGLRVASFALANVGVLRGRIDFGSFDPEITLITGDNELGKSTSVQALRAALFEKHNARHAGIRSLQPYQTKLAPEVWVEFVLKEQRYHLHKRFLQKPTAELRIDGSDTLVGSEADQRVWELLGSQAPGKQGAKKQDMGLWGLLWVDQDEAAFKDPATTNIGEETRGLLQEAIGRQVGALLSGRHGEHLRSRVLEEASRYWTAKTYSPTGELALSRTEATAAEARVQEIQGAIDEVEDRATRYASIAEQIEERLRIRPELEEELERARKDTGDLERLQQEVERTAAELQTSGARLDVAEEHSRSRQELREQRRTRSQRCDDLAASLLEMQETRKERVENAQTAAERLKEKEREAKAARDQYQMTTDQLEQARRVAEIDRLNKNFKRACEIASELEQLETQRGELLGDDEYGHLKSLDEERRIAHSKLASVGTKLAVSLADGLVEAVAGRERTIRIEGLGEVHIVPSQKGLDAARDRLGEARAVREEALRSLGLDDLESARERRRERIAAEVEAERLDRTVGELAADGVESLAEAVAAGRTALERDEKAYKRAKTDHKAMESLQRKLAENPVDEGTDSRILERAKSVEIAQAKLDAIGTSIDVRALDELELTWEGQETASIPSGETDSRTLTRPTKLMLDRLAELTITPGGEDVHLAGARLEAATEALGDILAQVGVGDLEQASVLARRWREIRAELVAVEAALREKAPQGLEELRGELSKRRKEQKRQEERLEEVRALEAARRRTGAALEGNSVTEVALTRLEELETEWRQARESVEQLAARVQLPGGEQRTIIERTTVAIEKGAQLEVVPGEGGASSDAVLERKEQELSEALAIAGVDDLDEATRRWKDSLALTNKIDGLRDQLDVLAPSGLRDLEESLAQFDEVASVDVGDLEELEKCLDEMRAAVRASERQVKEARDEERARARERDAFELEVRGREVELETTGKDLEDITARLDSARAEVSDDQLLERESEAWRARDKALQMAEEAKAALHALSPSLLDGELERAKLALQENREREQKDKEELASVKALLDRAAAEGRFEELGEAEAELEATRQNLARVERAAAGAKRLAQEVEQAYAAAQARFLAPVVREVRPYLTAIRPGTDVRMTPQLEVASVVRRGAEETFDSLSGGTREQLSVIVRLALAKVLARDDQSEPLPLILDDTMGWTDERRFVLMTRILRDASKQFQLLVLTCHPSRFERLNPGRTIDLNKLRELAVSYPAED